MLRYDFAAYDASGQLRVLIEAKRRTGTTASWARRFRRNDLAHGTPLPGELFAIVVPDKLYVWPMQSPPDAEPLEVDAQPLLAPYFQRAGTSPDNIDPMAFELLVSWWLSDLSRGELPEPGEALKRSGLIDALAGGRIVHQAAA
jgi:hypothetical protein